MFHRRCDKRIEYLQRLLDEERSKNRELQDQIVVMAEHPPIVTRGNGPANVYYMDDARLIEMIEEGDVPT